MSSFTPSSPEPSKCTATNVIPASANRSHAARIAAFAAASSGESDCSEFDGPFSMGLPFNGGDYAATKYYLGALIRTVRRSAARADAVSFPEGSTVSVLFLLRLLRARARSHARFEGCPPGRLTATSESGVFVSALPARHVLAPHPIGESPVQRLACVPAPSVGSL